MSTWNAAYMLLPLGSASPTGGDDAIRDVKSEVSQRMNQEHVWLNTASTGATVHRAGSGMAYLQAAEPTLRPDGVTALDSSDNGRLWIDSNDDNALYVWNATEFQTVGLTGNVTDLTVTNDASVGNDLDVTNDLFVTGKISTGGETAPDVDDGGICLNQGAADNNILTFKSSDIAHGMTDIEETDTYGAVSKRVSATGGLLIRGYGESTSGLEFAGAATNSDTTTSSSAVAPVMVYGSRRSGTTIVGSMSSNDNVFVVRGGYPGASGALFIVKGDGDIYYDGADQGSYDDEDDFGLVEAANRFRTDTSLHRERLEELGIVKNGFHSVRKMNMLQLGTLTMLINTVKGLAKRLGIAEDELMLMARGV